jgi:hypothetical protein
MATTWEATFYNTIHLKNIKAKSLIKDPFSLKTRLQARGPMNEDTMHSLSYMYTHRKMYKLIYP